ncbi:unannotated protein [freshwater metagenome]|uniref:Unannotated protein n=1 Tax=freshwater metagenome TaxID=449393 RepID=A0A6J6X1V3_9ZZZZ
MNLREPSRVLRATLPVKPSVTMTSTGDGMRSRPSTFPTKFNSARAASSWWVSLTRGVPLVDSSPIESRATLGSAIAKRVREKALAIWANCTNISGVHSALAPASTMTVGARPGFGSGVAMQGRTTPGRRPIRRSAAAIVAPVLPAEIIAEALPSRTSSAARTREESFFLRTPLAGSSSMPITSVQG